MRYEGKLYRPPSEADAYILQATIGCSWNKCTYCDMYRDKQYRVRDLAQTLEDIELAATKLGPRVQKLFVADGDALGMPMEHWLAVLRLAKQRFPNLRRVSCYAMASNVLEKSDLELALLRSHGLSMLYIGPESGDPQTLKRIAKGSTHEDHVSAASRARAAGMKLSVIVLLGIAGTARSHEHATATASLITGMDPAFFAALTTTVVPSTPLMKLQTTGRFELPTIEQMLAELREIVLHANPTDAVFRTNHASNYLPLGGRLPRDRQQIVTLIDRALAGKIALRPEWARGL